MAETASGGELSRVALAIAAVGGGETMVFDEIDAGIGGTTAHGVAETLSRLAGRAQVITITHLPQIASRADRHFRVEKVPGDPTHTRIQELGPDERRDEIERMLGGREFLATVEDERASLVEFTGPARLDRRTKRLVHRLGEDDVAIVDHSDLDRVTAEELLETGVRVVVNVSESLSGRFPNLGPLLLVRGGVTLIDVPGSELFDEVTEGEQLTVRGASVFRNGTCLARGRAREERELERTLAEQRGRVTESLSEFAENTLLHLRAEGSLLVEGIDFPPLRTRFRDRHALIVARGPGPQARPADRPPVRPRLQAGAGRRRRRRRRADRGRLQAGRDRRRHGLGLRRRAEERRRAARARVPRERRCARRRASARRSACRSRSSLRWGSARTSR